MVQALYFVRHGETDYNREGRFQGHADIPLNARGREQAAAVAAELAGHDIRTIVSQAPARLAPGGWLLLEHGWDQADAVQALLRAAGFTAVQDRKDLAGIVRCSGGQRPRVK